MQNISCLLYIVKLYKTILYDDNEQRIIAWGSILGLIYNNFIEQIIMFNKRIEKVVDLTINERLILH